MHHGIAHLDTVQTRLPAWLLAATPAQRAQLQALEEAALLATLALREVLAGIPSVRAFARPRLQAALIRAFGPGLHVDSHWFFWNHRCGLDPIETSPTGFGHTHPRHCEGQASLLEAALFNFPSTDGLDLPGIQQRVLAPGHNVAAGAFIAQVRKLDLGGQYQAECARHLPESAEAPAAVRASEHRWAVWRRDACVGHLSGALSAAAYEQLLEAAPAVQTLGVQVSGHPVEHLRLYHCSGAVVLYIPGCPLGAFSEYPNLAEAGRALLARAATSGCREVLLNHVALRARAAVAAALHTALGAPTTQPPAPGTVSTHALRLLSEHRLPADASGPWYRRWRQTVLDNAAQVAVPTAVLDHAQRMRRLAALAGIAQQVLLGAAMFVPGVQLLGLAGTVVAGYGVMDEVYEGIHAWNEGQVHEAVGHLFTLAANLAGEATGAAWGGHSAFIGGLHTTEGGRLWDGDTRVFAEPEPLPIGIEQGADGLWRDGDKAWAEIDAQFYPVAAHGGKAALVVPEEQRAPVPVLQRSGRRWHWAHRGPLHWQGEELLRAFEQVPAGLPPEALQAYQRLAQVSDGVLRQALLTGAPLPPLFEALLQRAAALEAVAGVPVGERSLAAEAYQARQEPASANDPISRQFPGLPQPFRRALRRAASSTEQHRLARGKLPPALGEAAAEYSRRWRLARLLDDVRQGLPGAERDHLLLSAAVSLPAWPSGIGVRLEAQGRWQEYGQAGTLHLRLAQHREGYSVADQPGALGVTLEQALLQALPAPARQALGWEANGAQQVRADVLHKLWQAPAWLREHMGMRPQPPTYFNPPRRFAGAVGYPLSGRGEGWWRSPPRERLRRLYPACSDAELNALLAELPTGRPLVQRLSALEQEWRVLDGGLRDWVGAFDYADADLAAGLAAYDLPTTPEAIEQARIAPQLGLMGVLADARAQIADELRACWRRERRNANGEFNLDLHGWACGGLPTVTATLSHVVELNLSNMHLAVDPSPLLTRLPNVQRVWLNDNPLPQLPAALGQLQRLDSLSVGRLPLQGPDAFVVLANGAPNLAYLYLDGALGQLPGNALAGLQPLPGLRMLSLTDNLLTPEHLQAIGELQRLEGLRMARCGLIFDQPRPVFLQGLAALRYLVVQGNRMPIPLSLEDQPRLEHLDVRSMRLREIPPAVLQRLAAQPGRLVHADLSDNAITDATALLGVLHRRSAQGAGVLLNDNPLPRVQAVALRAEGAQCLHSSDRWFSPNAGLLEAVETFRDHSQAANGFLKQVAEAVEDEAQWLPITSTAPTIRMLEVVFDAPHTEHWVWRSRPLVPPFAERLQALRRRLFEKVQEAPADAPETRIALLQSLRRDVRAFRAAQWIEPGDGASYERLLNELSATLGADTSEDTYVAQLAPLQPAQGLASLGSAGRWQPYLAYGMPEWALAEGLWDSLGEWLQGMVSVIDRGEPVPMAALSAEQYSALRGAAERAVEQDRLLVEDQEPAATSLQALHWGDSSPPPALPMSQLQYAELYRALAHAREHALLQLGRRLTQRLVHAWWEHHRD